MGFRVLEFRVQGFGLLGLRVVGSSLCSAFRIFGFSLGFRLRVLVFRVLILVFRV